MDFGSPALVVAVDPIDGSLNARRGLHHAAVSIAVATGDRIGDVELAIVRSITGPEAYYAVRGAGAFAGDTRITSAVERTASDGRLELLCIETSDSSATAAVAAQLASVAYRWRILGSIVEAMCHVAAGYVDAMVNVSDCRVIDAAAATLIVEESGGSVCLSAGKEARLQLDQRTRLAAARTGSTAEALLAQIV